MHSNWFVRGDVDSFFGLFSDNLANLIAYRRPGRTLPGVAALVGCSMPGRPDG